MSSVSVSSGRIFSGGEKAAFTIEDVEDEDFFVALAVRRGRPEVGRALGDYCGRYRWRKEGAGFVLLQEANKRDGVAIGGRIVLRNERTTGAS